MCLNRQGELESSTSSRDNQIAQCEMLDWAVEPGLGDENISFASNKTYMYLLINYIEYK